MFDLSSALRLPSLHAAALFARRQSAGVDVGQGRACYAVAGLTGTFGGALGVASGPSFVGDRRAPSWQSLTLVPRAPRGGGVRARGPGAAWGPLWCCRVRAAAASRVGGLVSAPGIGKSRLRQGAGEPHCAAHRNHPVRSSAPPIFAPPAVGKRPSTRRPPARVAHPSRLGPAAHVAGGSGRLRGRDPGRACGRCAPRPPRWTGILGGDYRATDGVPLFVEGGKAVLDAPPPARGARDPAARPGNRQIGAVLGREFSACLGGWGGAFCLICGGAWFCWGGGGFFFWRGSAAIPRHLFKHALVQDAAYGTFRPNPRVRGLERFPDLVGAGRIGASGARDRAAVCPGCLFNTVRGDRPPPYAGPSLLPAFHLQAHSAWTTCFCGDLVDANPFFLTRALLAPTRRWSQRSIRRSTAMRSWCSTARISMTSGRWRSRAGLVSSSCRAAGGPM